MGTRTDTLVVKLTSDGSGRVKATLADTASSIDVVGQKTEKTNTQLINYRRILGTLSAGALIAYTRAVFQNVNQLQDQADKLGLNVELLQELRATLNDAGGSTATLDTAMQRFVRKIGDAQRGTGEAVNVFRELNVTLEDAQGNTRSIESILNDTADAIAGMSNDTERLSATVKLFDSEGAIMKNILQGGSGALDELRQSARESGRVIDAELVAEMTEANNEFERAQDVIETKLIIALGQLAPVLVNVATAFEAASKGSREFFESTKPISEIKSLDVLKEMQEVLLAERVEAQGNVKTYEKLAASSDIWAGTLNSAKDRVAQLTAEINALNDQMLDLQTAQSTGDVTIRPQADPWAGDAGHEQRLQKLLSILDPVREQTRLYEQAVNDLNIAWANGLISDEYYESMIEKLATMEEASEKSANVWADVWTSAGNRMAAGIGDAVADALLQQQTFADAMKAVLRGVLHQVISTLVEIGVKKVALAAIGDAALAASTAASAAAAATVSAVWAPAAAEVSLATFGANAVPASAALAETHALSAGLALAGIAHGGLDNVPREGTYLLQQGEMVLSPGNADALSKMLKQGGGRPIVINQSISTSSIDTNGVAAFIQRAAPIFKQLAVAGVQEAMTARMRRGPLG